MKDRLMGAVIFLGIVWLCITMAGCSGSGFVAVGGSGALYNPNNEYAPKIVQQQPTQSVTVGRAKILPMVKGGE